MKAFWLLTPAQVLSEAVELNMKEARVCDWPTDALLAQFVWDKPLSHLAGLGALRQSHRGGATNCL